MTEILKYLSTKKGKIVTAAGIAHAIGIERIYGPTMSKLVREGVIEPMPCKGYYRAI